MATGLEDDVNARLEMVIFRLYALMTQAADHDSRDRRETVATMHNEILSLIQALTFFSRSSQNLRVEIPLDIMHYVESGRNPDIYNREFVEALQGLNRGLGGRSRAYAQFRDVLAGEIRTSIPEITAEVNETVGNVGGQVPH